MSIRSVVQTMGIMLVAFTLASCHGSDGGGESSSDIPPIPPIPPEKSEIVANWSYSKPEINKDTFIVKFEDNSTVKCSGDSTPLYKWDFGNGKTSSEQNPSVTYKYAQGAAQPDGIIQSYDVSLTVSCVALAKTDNDNMSDTKVDKVSVTQDDLSRMSTSTIGIGDVIGDGNGFSLQFSNKSETVCLADYTTYEWDFGDGTTSTEREPSKKYDATGYTQEYNVSLVIKCSGQQIANSNHTVKVAGNEEQWYKVKSDFTYAPSAMTETTLSVKYYDASAISCMKSTPSYAWVFGDGSKSTEASPIKEYPYSYASGIDFTDNVALTVSCGAKSDIKKKQAVITLKEALPTLPPTKIITDWGYSKPEFNKDTFLVKFTDNSSVSCNELTPQYLWEFGDGTTSTEKEPTHVYSYDPSKITETENITKNVKLTITCSGNPPEDASSADNQPSGITITAADLARASIVNFAVGDIIGDKTAFAIKFSNRSETVCTQANTSYSWDFGDGSEKSTAFEPEHTYAVTSYPADYLVTLSVSCAGAETDTPKIERISVSSNDSEWYKITSDWTYEKGTVAATRFSLQFTDRSVIKCFDKEPVYSWNFGDGSFSSDKNPLHEFGYVAPLDFADNVSLTVFCGAKSNKSVKKVTATANEDSFVITPAFDYAQGTVNDNKVDVKFTNTSIISCPGAEPKYKWTFGDVAGGTSAEKEPQYSYAYTKPLNLAPKATLIVTCGSKSEQKQETLTLAPKTTDFQTEANWDYSQTTYDVASGATIAFNNKSVASCPGVEPAYEWDFGDSTAKSTDKNPTHLFTPAAIAAGNDVSLIVKCAGAADSAPKAEKLAFITIINDWSFLVKGVNYKNPYETTISFSDASAISCPGTPSYEWNFGDAAPVITTDKVIEHTYQLTALPSTLTVSMTVICGKFKQERAATIIVNDVRLFGAAYHAFTFANGKTYAWGADESGQLGNSVVNGVKGAFSSPFLLTNMDNKILIAGDGGYDYSALLTDAGELYTFGNYTNGQLGLGNISAVVSTPMKVAFNPTRPVKFMAAGFDHMLAVTNDGKLYGWGKNTSGEVGAPPAVPVWSPRLIADSFDGAIVAVTAGVYLSAALTDQGSVYTWGNNDVGQLGIGTTGGTKNTPQLVTGLTGKNIIAISSFGNSMMALEDNGDVYTWGKNEKGELGIGDNINKNVPTKVDALSNIVAISMGFSHAIAITSGGQLYTWGNNDSGQLGIGGGGNKNIPTLVTIPNGEKVLVATAKTEWSIALTDGGKIYSWGLNHWAQLGLGTVGGTNNVPKKITFPAGSGIN